MNVPALPEMVIAAPRARERYFHELVAGGLWLVTAILAAIGMLYMVMFHGELIGLRFFYFLVIALSLGVMMLGIKMIMDSESERALAIRVKDREWVLDSYALQLGAPLVEGMLRAVLRKAAVPALDIQMKEVKEARMEPSSDAQACLILGLSGLESQGFDLPLEVRVQRRHLAQYEEKIRDHFTALGIALAGDWPVAVAAPLPAAEAEISPLSSQSGPPAPRT